MDKSKKRRRSVRQSVTDPSASNDTRKASFPTPSVLTSIVDKCILIGGPAHSALLTRKAAVMSVALPRVADQISQLYVKPWKQPLSSVGACLVVPSVGALRLTYFPPVILADVPFEIRLNAVDLCTGGNVADCMGPYISAYAILNFSVEAPGKTPRCHSVRVATRASGSGLIARALICPSSWADAASLTVMSLTLAGRPVRPLDILPITLRVGYNHSISIPGAVYEAAGTGDTVALQAALDAGGSTEEGSTQSAAYQAARLGHFEALRTLLLAGADPAAINMGGRTPLHAAAYKGHDLIVALLLATPGVDPLARSKGEGRTPLYWALRNGHTSAAALLQGDTRVKAALAVAVSTAATAAAR